MYMYTYDFYQVTDKATWKWVFNLPWHKAGPLNQLADTVEADQ